MAAMPPAKPMTSEDVELLLQKSQEPLLLQIAALQKQVDEMLRLQAGGHSVVADDDARSLTITDANGNKIVMSPQGILLESTAAMTLVSAGATTVTSKNALTLAAANDASLTGLNVAIQGSVGATLKGIATAEISASGQTTVKGAMVMIN